MREVFCGVTRKGGTLFFMEDTKICSFFGHREIEESEALSEELRCAVLNVLNRGCRIFYFGGFGDFDALAHKIVTETKDARKDIEIKRIYCVHSEYYLRKKHKYIKCEDYEEVIYLEPSFKSWYKSIYFRNLAMIDKSEYVIFYAENRKESGAYKAFNYALGQKNKRIFNLFKEKPD